MMTHTSFYLLGVLPFAAFMCACQGTKQAEVEQMPYTVPATAVTPAMEADYYTGPVNADSLPDGPDGYILYKADQSCYMGAFKDGFPLPQIAADSFMIERAKDTTLSRTPSGVLYRVLAEGSGQSPKATDEVTFLYEGRLTDGTIFDSNYDRAPLTCPASNLIKGFTEALTLMKPGAEWEVIIPFHLAYGVRGSSGSIPQYAPLIFKLKLIK